MAIKENYHAAYDGIPITINSSTYHETHNGGCSLDQYFLTEHHEPRRDAPNGLTCLIFGLRGGFLSQIMVVSAVYLSAYHELVTTAMNSMTGVLLCVTLWIGVTTLSAILSLKSFSWLHKLPQEEQFQTGDEDLHLIHGCMIGIYFTWLLFDLVAVENGLLLLFLQSALVMVGVLLSKCLQRKRRVVNDELLKFLDLL